MFQKHTFRGGDINLGLPPSEGHPSRGHPSERHPSQGNPSERHPSQGYPSQGHPSRRHPSRGRPSSRLGRPRRMTETDVPEMERH